MIALCNASVLYVYESDFKNPNYSNLNYTASMTMKPPLRGAKQQGLSVSLTSENRKKVKAAIEGTLA